MPDSKLVEGFLILTPGKIPNSILREVKHYNNLLATYDNSPQQKQAIINSEDKIRQLLLYKNIYPIHIVYGHMTLISLLQEPEINVSKFITELESIRKTYGDDYFESLLLFEPSNLSIKDNLGWSYGGIKSIDLGWTQNNIFMLAVKSGNTELVSSILKLISDKNLQKKILLQAMQYWNDNELLFKPVLQLAIESGSDDCLKFIMETMKELGILKEAAQSYQALMTGNNQYHNLLSTVTDIANTAMVGVILQYQTLLGRIFYLFNDKLYPNYINTKMSIMPVFLKAMISHSSKVFDQIFNANSKALSTNPNDDYWAINFNVKALASAVALIDLNSYVCHRDFNAHIFKRVLRAKIDLNQQLQDLSLMRKRFCHTHGIPFPVTKQGEYSDIMQDRLMLLTGKTAVDTANFKQQLDLKQILCKLYEDAIQAKNFNAGGIVLLELYNNGYIDAFDGLIEKLSRSKKNQFCNYLLSQAVSEQNSSIMDTLLKHQFTLDLSPFHALARLKNPHTLVFVAKELVHRLIDNKFEYQSVQVKIILGEVLRIVHNKENDVVLNQAIDNLIEDIKEYQKNVNKSFSFLSPTSVDLSPLMIEIQQTISVANKYQ